MNNLFPLYDETNAPEAARHALAATKRNFGSCKATKAEKVSKSTHTPS